MKSKNYGRKFVCRKCACVFYDLGKEEPLCPKCGTRQSADAHLLRDGLLAKKTKRKSKASINHPVFLDVSRDLDFTEL